MEIEVAIRSLLTFSRRAGASAGVQMEAKVETEASASASTSVSASAKNGCNLFRTCPRGVCSMAGEKGNKWRRLADDSALDARDSCDSDSAL